MVKLSFKEEMRFAPGLSLVSGKPTALLCLSPGQTAPPKPHIRVLRMGCDMINTDYNKDTGCVLVMHQPLF